MMHYFKRNIGDYHKKAGRLSMLEHGAYTLLLDACYDRERFPTQEEAIDWCWAKNKAEIDAVEFVLRKFFELIDGIYIQARIQDEIDAYHATALKNKAIAEKRESDKRTLRAPVVHAPCTDGHLTINQEPLTNNHKPKDQEPPAQAPIEDLFPKFWKLYPKKQDKAKAQKAWAKLKVDEALFTMIARSLALQAVTADWTKEGGKYVPLPTTWLNGKRWEDEIAPPANVHQFPAQTRHSGFDNRDYKAGTKENANGTFRI